MKAKLYIILVLILTMSCNIEPKKKEEKKIATSKSISKNMFEDMEGNVINLSDYKGKKIVLNFWATWCASCIEEMPSMLKSQDILEKENYVFLLASDESTEKIKKFIEKTNYKFKFIKYNGSLAKLKIHVLPTTFVYNEKGEKVDTIVGAVEWDSDEMIEKLKQIN